MVHPYMENYEAIKNKQKRSYGNVATAMKGVHKILVNDISMFMM